MRFRTTVPAVVFVSSLAMAGCAGKASTTQPTAREFVEGGVLLEQAGSLEAGDLETPNGFTDHYEIAVSEGDRLRVDLASEAFDPFLEIVLPEGGALVNDDWEGDRNLSRVEFVASASGILKLRVRSYVAGGQGAYRVRVVRQVEAAPDATTTPGEAVALR
ncbi:MAG: hypothetical protein AAGF12_43305, partial [Myxococcota bacterium]